MNGWRSSCGGILCWQCPACRTHIYARDTAIRHATIQDHIYHVHNLALVHSDDEWFWTKIEPIPFDN